MIPFCETSKGILLQRSDEFEPDQILDCGQCFRWNRCPDGAWEGFAGRHPVRLSPCAQGWIFENVTLEDFHQIWIPYFDLDTDYGKIRAELSSHSEILAKAAAFSPGMRILRQDPWEALCSFILSQNNNIPRIKGIVSRLCEFFGEEGIFFPTPQSLAQACVEDLAPLRSGFRAKYILSAAQLVSDGTVDLEAVRTLPLSEARASLMQILGVGVKVAECALLYGLHRLDAFPIDVWIRRVMERYFPGMDPAAFGPYAGIAQQYLFHYIRSLERGASLKRSG